jgi:hypothetical protein
MILRGHCKKDFEKWYNDAYFKKEELSLLREENRNLRQKQDLLFFYLYNFSIQFGVYVDFFDSVGIFIGVNPYAYHIPNTLPSLIISSYDYEIAWQNGITESSLPTRQEARVKAIEKANSIYNT